MEGRNEEEQIGERGKERIMEEGQSKEEIEDRRNGGHRRWNKVMVGKEERKGEMKECVTWRKKDVKSE